MTRPQRIAVIVAAVVTILVGAGVLVAALWYLPRHSNVNATPGRSHVSASPSADAGVTACRLMLEDKRNAAKPAPDREAAEFAAMARSANPDLQAAAAILVTRDMNRAGDAIGRLYAGCAAVGVPLT